MSFVTVLLASRQSFWRQLPEYHSWLLYARNNIVIKHWYTQAYNIIDSGDEVKRQAGVSPVNEKATKKQRVS